MFRGDESKISDELRGPVAQDLPPAHGDIMRPVLDGLRFRDAGDWRTLVLLIGVEAVILFSLFKADSIPFPSGLFISGMAGVIVTIAILAPLMTLYSSTQHEVIHGHPFKSQLANDLTCLIPLAIIVPLLPLQGHPFGPSQGCQSVRSL